MTLYSFATELLLKSFVVGSAGLVSLAALRNRSAALKSQVLGVVLLVLVILPFASALSPKRVLLLQQADQISTSAIHVVSGASFTVASARRDVHETPFPWAATFLVLWLIGVATMQGGLFLDFVAARRGIKRLTRAPGEENGFQVAYTNVHGPSAWGVGKFRALILATHTDPAHHPALLAHETAHLMRNDWIKRIAFRFVRGFYWPNPLVWLLERQFVVLSEMACDDYVLSRGVDPVDYAHVLIQVAKVRRRLFTALPNASTPPLKKRICAVLQNGRDRRLPSRNQGLTIASLGLLVLVAVAPVTLSAQTGNPWIIGKSTSGGTGRLAVGDNDWVSAHTGGSSSTGYTAEKQGDGTYVVHYMNPSGAFAARGRAIRLYENGIQVWTRAKGAQPPVAYAKGRLDFSMRSRGPLAFIRL